MGSLAVLAMIALGAFFTPLLPLQPPDDDNTSLQYESPQYWPLFLETFRFDWQTVRESPARLQQVRRELQTAEQRGLCE